VLLLQTISADAPAAEKASAPAPAIAPKRAFLNIVMTVPVPLFLFMRWAHREHQRSILGPVPQLGQFQAEINEKVLFGVHSRKPHDEATAVPYLDVEAV
jgi:hypothetical protein